VTIAVRERLERVRGSVPREQRLRQIRTISARSSALRARNKRFVYAFAREQSRPLLFKGDDFSQTDIDRVGEV
jgi:uncharacterized protein with PIN domain